MIFQFPCIQCAFNLKVKCHLSIFPKIRNNFYNRDKSYCSVLSFHCILHTLETCSPSVNNWGKSSDNVIFVLCDLTLLVYRPKMSGFGSYPRTSLSLTSISVGCSHQSVFCTNHFSWQITVLFRVYCVNVMYILLFIS